MNIFILFFRKIRDVKNKYLKIFLFFSSSLVFGQTITPTKTVVRNVNSCEIIDVELSVLGANPISRPLEVVLVIDVSGSMASGSPDTSLDYAKDAAIDFINNIFNSTNNPTGLNKVAIVSYSTTATIKKVLTLSSGQAELITAVNELNANGLTNIQDGIVKADNELTAHGSFNCNTSRSIILLTDGVTNVMGTSGSSCTGGTSGTCIQSAITAATNAKTTTVSSVVYNNQIFSVGLFGGISGTDQTNATYCLNNIQSGGAFFTESAANLTGIYAQILNQISWVAAQIPGTPFDKEIISNNFNIVAGSISVSKGTFTQSGQVIDWNIDFLNSETITLKYQLTPKLNICGDNIVSTSRLDYLNSSCLASFQNITTPNYCVPCTPILSELPSPTTINCPETLNFITPTITNGCLSTSLTFNDITTPSTACPLLYSVKRTWTASNSCYSVTASQTINVQDVTSPNITPLPTISTINCPAIPIFTTATATDACGGTVTLIFADETIPGTCVGNYSITRTWTAKDNCNNTSTASQTINIQDTTAPSLSTQASNSTVECDGNGNTSALASWLASNSGASASDTCSSVTWTNNYSGALSDLCGLTGAATVIFTATDTCGNYATSTGTFTIQDTTPPSLSTQASNLTLECDGNGNTSALASWLASNSGASASDTCSSVTWTNNYSGALSDLCGLTGAATVIFTATDTCGNYATSTGTFTIQDTTPPEFTTILPEFISVSCDAIPHPLELTGVDTCSSEIMVITHDVIVEDESNFIGQFNILRTWTITDDCGNNKSFTQTISVYDNVAPTLLNPIKSELNVICSEIPPKPELEFVDNCSGINPNIIYTETITTISIYEYVIVREWTVSDNCGNVANFSQAVNVSVNEPFDAIPYRICKNETVDLLTLLNDGLPTNGTWIELNTTGAISGSIFNPSNLAYGNYTIRYIVNVENAPCPFIYEVYINVANCDVLAACDLKINNAVSPNGDGLNEIFMIEGIDCYPNNSVEIYNRWGVNVYKAIGYNNNNISFNGFSQNKLTVGDDKLPGDTYFYILKYSDDQNNSFEKTGYLYIKY